MGYCTISDVDNILANALTSATDPTGNSRANLLSIGKSRNKNNVSDDIVNQYIQWAGQEIDASLSELYKTPFCEKVDFEGELFADIAEYNSYVILAQNCPLAVGDNIIIIEGDTEERHEIESIIGSGIFSTESPVMYPFSYGSRVLRIKYPDPIPFICCRLAAANIYDKYFAAQVSPNISEYGKYLREQARQRLNDIRIGGTILHGVKRVGRRFYDPTLVDQYGLPRGSDPDAKLDALG